MGRQTSRKKHAKSHRQNKTVGQNDPRNTTHVIHEKQKVRSTEVRKEAQPPEKSTVVPATPQQPPALEHSEKATICLIDRDTVTKSLTDLCTRLSTDSVSVEMTEDTRKLDAGIVYYIVHIKAKKPDEKRVPTRKTGVYFTRVKDRIHVQVINGTSMVLLYSNYSADSQTEVFKYLESIVKKDMEFYQNSRDAKFQRRKEAGVERSKKA